MTGRVAVRVVCLHGGREEHGAPTTILEREVYPGGRSSAQAHIAAWVDAHPDADPDGPVPSELEAAVSTLLADASSTFAEATRGRWVKDGQVVTKFGDVRDGAHAQHQLTCHVCGVTERVTETDLRRVLEHAAGRSDTPSGKVAPLGGIERYARLID